MFFTNTSSAQEKNLQRFTPGLKTEFGKGFFTSFNPKAPSYGGCFYKAGITADVRLDKTGNWYLTSAFQYDKRFLIQRDEYPYALTAFPIYTNKDIVYNLRAEFIEMNLGLLYMSDKIIKKHYYPFINLNAQPQYLVNMVDIINPLKTTQPELDEHDVRVINRIKYFNPWNFSLSSTIGLQREVSWCAVRAGINIDAQLTEPQREMTSNYSGKKYKFKNGSYYDPETGEGGYSNLRSYAIGLNLQWLIY
jgi:hypothetical protein